MKERMFGLSSAMRILAGTGRIIALGTNADTHILRARFHCPGCGGLREVYGLGYRGVTRGLRITTQRADVLRLVFALAQAVEIFAQRAEEGGVVRLGEVDRLPASQGQVAASRVLRPKRSGQIDELPPYGCLGEETEQRVIDNLGLGLVTLGRMQQQDAVAAVGVQPVALPSIRHRRWCTAIGAVGPQAAQAPAGQLFVEHRILIEGQSLLVVAEAGGIVPVPDGMDAEHRPGVLPARQDERFAIPLPDVRARSLWTEVR